MLARGQDVRFLRRGEKHPETSARWRRAAGVLAAGVLLMTGACLGWSLFVEPARLVVHRETLHLGRWDPAHRGLRVALLSDLHVGSPHWGPAQISDLVRRTNELHPDLVLLAGDYLIDHVPFGDKVTPEVIARLLAPLSAPLGVYAVLGNHDCWNDGPRVKAALVGAGLHVLEDERATLTYRGRPLVLLGLADQLTHRAHAAALIAATPPVTSMLVLVHEPDTFAALDGRVSLMLAGHTHGGQVDLPWLGRLGAGIASRFGRRYAAGHVEENGRHLFVTTGVGTSVFPIRFRVPPEIALLTLS